MTFEEISAAFFFTLLVVGSIGFAYLVAFVSDEENRNDD